MKPIDKVWGTLVVGTMSVSESDTHTGETARMKKVLVVFQRTSLAETEAREKFIEGQKERQQPEIHCKRVVPVSFKGETQKKQHITPRNPRVFKQARRGNR